jgi:hypothetical protein
MSNNWSIRSGTLACYQNIDETSTTKRHDLGTEVQAFDESGVQGVCTFVYCLGVASTIATDWAVIGEDFATTRLTADLKGPVGVAMSANVANQYGWYQRVGKAIGGSGGAIVDGAAIYATGAGAVGTVDDAVVDGDMVHNAFARSTIAGAAITGQFQIDRPYVDDIAGND